MASATLNFTGVKKSGVEALDKYLEDRGMIRSGGDQGTVSGSGFEMDFSLDVEAGSLQLDLRSWPDYMPSSHIEYAVKDMLESGEPFGIAGRRAELLERRFAWG